MNTTPVLSVTLKELRAYGSNWLVEQTKKLWNDFEDVEPNYLFPSTDSYSDYEVQGFKGYQYTDSNGNKAHTWDFEESIGE